MALSRHHVGTSRPLNIEEIVREASNFEFIPNRPLKSWLRSAQMLLTEAAICEQDGDLQRAYLYLYRHAQLVLAKFPEHPDYKDPAFKADVKQAQKTVQANLIKLEEWKPRIQQQHERYAKAIERRNAEKERVHEERLYDERQRLAEQDYRRGSVGSEDSPFDDSHALNANEHRELAVDLAHREIRRRDATKSSTRKAGISPNTVAARRRGVIVEPTFGHEEPPRQHGLDPVSESIKEAGRHLRHHGHRQIRTEETREDRRSHATYSYPSVPTKEAAINWRTPALQPQPRATIPGLPPALPTKQSLDPSSYQGDGFAPPIPARPRVSESQKSPAATPSPPSAEPFQPPAKYTFKPNAFTESGAPLRTVLLPPELRTTFLNLAHPNTLRNFETCGILCGTLISNALFINRLIIPDQISTSDTCDTTEEGDNELFDFCDSNDLLVCGWIHTHPSQSCFLSSRDLHTSSGYQVMLPEAIAIVCAPKHNPDWGIFRLTDPPGLNHVLNCTQKGLFHPHSETNLYTDALRPGHVVEGPGLKFEVVDLRWR